MEKYDVLIVDRPESELPGSWRDVPAGAVCIEKVLRDIPGWAALAWARSFNEAEQNRPIGVWAVVRECAPEFGANGRFRP
jgi:hypothetical protein